MNEGTDLWTVVTIVGMTAITVITRAFFFLSDKPWTLPAWAQRGMPYAPIAALAAVIVPEVVMTQGELISTWKDARLFAVAAGLAWFYWRKGVLGTLLCGMAVYLPLRIGLGW
ncbi:MAG: AzlD domain-containing protein [Polaromonas sp.]|nr:AzlD domain-containing protein [Polaromonas sp.]